MIKIILKNKKILKSSKVRQYVKEVESLINKLDEEQDLYGKTLESIALGVPLKMHSNGRIEVLRNYYKEGKGIKSLVNCVKKVKKKDLKVIAKLVHPALIAPRRKWFSLKRKAEC